MSLSEHLNNVYQQTADGGYFDFARCQRKDGTIYASPTDTCRKGKRIDGDAPKGEKAPKSASKKMQLTAKIKAMSAADLEKVAADSRLSDRQKRTLNRLIKAKVAEEKAKLDTQPTVKESPTPTKTPGESRPLANALETLGPKAQRFLEAKSEFDALDAQIKKLEASGKTYEEMRKEGIRFYQLDERRDTLRSEIRRLEKSPDFIPLDNIYKAQGYNAKPELVATRGELEQRNDLATGPDGKPIIAFRGVTEQKFADQFRGIGPDGDIHFTGKGIYGNGTYAAAASPGKTKDQAVATALTYADLGDGAGARVTAFGFRNDANLRTFEGATQEERWSNYNEWRRGIEKEASDLTGLPINDTGHAAAIMGIHAYQVPQTQEDDEDYWVVLNRGATIQALDAQI